VRFKIGLENLLENAHSNTQIFIIVERGMIAIRLNNRNLSINQVG
jgi:hypothetical protein